MEYVDFVSGSFDTMEYAFQWFQSYLSKRKQLLVINNTQSDISDLCKYGIPQGSVLRPMLFLLFMNDIHRSLSEITINSLQMTQIALYQIKTSIR